MNQHSITQYITDTFAGVDVVVASGDAFFIYDPDRAFDPARRFPFATLVTDDTYDRFSNLSRPSVFRLNIGVSRDTYRALFGSQTASFNAKGDVDSDYDFTALDQIMPHPVYGKMFWVCVLNPSAATFQSLQPLLAEAYDLSVKRNTKANAKARTQG